MQLRVCFVLFVCFQKKYTKAFKDNGFDNTMLISGMTEKELKDIGIKTKGTKQKLLQEIQQLPTYEIVAEVPVNITFEVPVNTTFEVPVNIIFEVPVNITFEVPVNITFEVPVNITFEVPVNTAF